MSWKVVPTTRCPEAYVIAHESCGWALGLEAEFYV
jgi:hypothetical protein